MKQKDQDRVNRYKKAYPANIMADADILSALNSLRAEKRQVDRAITAAMKTKKYRRSNGKRSTLFLQMFEQC